MSYPKPLHWWVDNVLPLVYDNALSYYEVLSKVTTYINGLTGDMTNVKDEIEAIQAIIENADIEDLPELVTRMDTLESQLNTQSQRITALTNTTGASVSSLSSRIITETNQRTAADTELGNRITQETNDRTDADNTLNTNLNNEIAEREENFKELHGAFTEFYTERGWVSGTWNPLDGTTTTFASNIRENVDYSIKGGCIYAECDDGYVFTVFAYNFDGTFVGTYQQDGTLAPVSSNIKPVTYFRFSDYPDYYFHIGFRRDPISQDITTDDHVHFHIYGINGFGYQWFGRVGYFYGTSLTQRDNSYWKEMCHRMGIIPFNKGISGQGIGNLGADSTGAVYNAICNNTDGKTNAQFIVLETGANDVNASVPLGTIYDTGRTTLAGCLNDCLRYLQANTNAQVVVMPSTASKVQPNASDKVWEWKKMIREICFINCVPFIDCDNNLGYGKVSSTNYGDMYLVDNIHPNALGARVTGYNFEAQLKSVPLFLFDEA